MECTITSMEGVCDLYLNGTIVFGWNPGDYVLYFEDSKL